jgi:1,5-anhydro-D-fructose reductase (1,5-anhydro-D-mannitol-forming)
MTNKPNTPLRWGMIGLGWVAGDYVAPSITHSKGSELVACLGSTPAKSRAFAQRFGNARAHDDLMSLLGDTGIDAVYIALPNAMHHAAVLAAAAAGKHILCEKPFAMDLAHAREMSAACTNAGVVLRVAHQLRLEAAVVRAREIVQSGRLGRLVSISLERASGNPPRVSWRLDVPQSGVIFDVGVHLLDMVRWITGREFVEVSAFSHPDRKLGKSDDTISIAARLDNECHATIRATREVATAENNLIVQGSKATLVTSALRFAKEHFVRVRDADGTTEERFPLSPVYDLEIEGFESDVRGVRSMLPQGQDGVRIVAATQAALQSIAERRIVAVPV